MSCSSRTVRPALQRSVLPERKSCLTALCSTRTLTVCPVLPERYVLPHSALFYQNGMSCLTALCSTRTVCLALQRSVLPEQHVLFYQNGMSCLKALCSTRTVRPALQRSVLPERYVIPYNALFYLDTLKFPLLL